MPADDVGAVGNAESLDAAQTDGQRPASRAVSHDRCREQQLVGANARRCHAEASRDARDAAERAQVQVVQHVPDDAIGEVLQREGGPRQMHWSKPMADSDALQTRIAQARHVLTFCTRDN